MRSLLAAFLALAPLPAFAANSPNVLIVITDDQGFGDLGAHGNPILRTPNLDAFAKQSVWLKNFYVSPVCSPTRSSLLTGLYNYRTGVVDTYIGRSLMRPGVKTLAEYLAAAGYRTGLFGKWHLGDNFPLRPEDRGFQETLWSQGGGLAQPSDHPDTNPATAYFDPILKRNGKELRTKGYCTDVFTDAALAFVTANNEMPFFAYVAFNAPHAPHQVPENFSNHYAKLDLGEKSFPKIGHPWTQPERARVETAKIYGMIENIDSNFGRLMAALAELKLAENTIVIFLTDNGPFGIRYNAGLRDRKGTVYEGGIRVPCYIRWPANFKGGREITVPLAHIDISPTILAACGVKADTSFDGRNFLPFLQGQSEWPERNLFFQWHRGNVPERYRSFAARGPQFKLVQATSTAEGAKWTPKFELFDIVADPFEMKDLAAEKPKEVAKLKAAYETWFADVTKAGFDPPRIVVGSKKENPVRLSRQDWRGPKAGWAADSIGHWEIELEKPGRYRITARSREEFDAWEYDVVIPQTQRDFTSTSSKKLAKPVKSDTAAETMLPAGRATLEVRVSSNGKKRGPTWVEVEYLGEQ